jgi:hypothetical protein
VSWGIDPDGDCLGTERCNGASLCKLVDGQGCGLTTDCLSLQCTDGVCCDLACGGPCQACSAALTGGPNGVCDFVIFGTDPDGDCPANQLCDSAGQCKKDDGQPCGGAGECLNGFCPTQDSVCCNAACTAGCEACLAAKTGGTDGTCDFVSFGIDPDNDCAATERCDGGGVCLRIDGQPCIVPSQCLSDFCPADDGVCCDQACGALCWACLASKTGGTDGTCDYVLANTDPDTDCPGGHNCDGAGACD